MMSMTRYPQSPHDPQFVPYRCDDCGFTVHHPVYVKYAPECPECGPVSSQDSADPSCT